MRVLVAPDKFKGSATAAEVASAMAEGVVDAVPSAEVTVRPIADGGDGFLDAVLARADGATVHHVDVADALGRPRHARFVLVGATAYVEAAEAVSVTHQEPTPAVALRACSRGVGELVRAALDAGVARVVVGLGGTATNDAGAGMLRALGASVLDADGQPVGPGGACLRDVAAVGLTGLDRRLAAIELVGAVDVDNPLLGPSGAVRVFAPQKGADRAASDRLEEGFVHWHRTWREQAGLDLDVPGGGAAGGLGAALGGPLGARIVPGADLVLELCGITPATMVEHDLVLTGEGCFDTQSLSGKGPHAVVAAATGSGADVGLVVGGCTLPDEQVAALGVVGLRCLAAAYADPFDDPTGKVRAQTAALVAAWRRG